jgi:excisionase family DNA binding protein
MDATSEVDVMTTKQAAERLGTSQDTIRRMVRKGELWGAKVAGWMYVYRPEVEALAKAREH